MEINEILQIKIPFYYLEPVEGDPQQTHFNLKKLKCKSSNVEIRNIKRGTK